MEDKIKLQGKKLLLLIDNIDELLGKLKEKEQRQLREILLTSSSFRIIGGSTKMIEQHHDYSKPFYEFFKIIKLKGLDYEDSIKFLKTIAKDKFYKWINKNIRETYPNFNIGITTGLNGDYANLWFHKYRHWRFVPKNSRVDFSGSKTQKRKAP